MRSVTKVLQKKKRQKISAARRLFFELKHGAGLLRPAVLRHIFAVELGLTRFKIGDIVALDQACIDTVARGLVTKNVFRADRL